MVGVTLIDFISYQAAFGACRAFNGLALAFAYLGTRTATSVTQSAESQTTAPFLHGLLSTRIMFLAGIALLLSIGTTVQAPVIGEYTSEVLHTKLSVLGLMLLAPATLSVLLIIRFGHLADRFGRQVPLIAGLAVAAVCYYELSQTTHPFLAAHLVVIAGLACAVSIPAWGAAALDASELAAAGCCWECWRRYRASAARCARRSAA